MRIGNQPQPTVVDQPRMRRAEASGSLAKAAPRFQVGRVAAFVRHINNGTFGSAETRAYRSGAKPAAFSGGLAKANAPVVRAAPSAERMPALPPLKSPALVLALTGVVNRGSQGGPLSAPSAPPLPPPTQADMTSTLKPCVAHLSATFESAALPQPSYAQTMREARDKRMAKLAFLPSTLAATTRLQRIGTRVPESARTPAPPERYEGMLRTDTNEIHPLAIIARAESDVPLSPDAGPDRLDLAGMTHVCQDGDAQVGIDEVDCPVEAWDTDDLCASDWGDDFDSDSDSGFDDEITENTQPQTAPSKTPQSLRHLAIATLLNTAFKTLTTARAKTTTEAPRIIDPALQEGGAEQLRRDVVLYRSELEAFDQLPQAARMEGVESVKADEAVTAVENSRDEASLNDALIRAFVQKRRQESLNSDSTSDLDSDSDLDEEWD